ncbi:MAG: DUF4124 domain-containing protein [Burkholderiales bacterium]
MYRGIIFGTAIATIAAAVLPQDAAAQTYRCITKEGKVYYGQTMPTACIGQVVEQLNAQGLVIKRIVPNNVQMEDSAAKEAEEKKKMEEAARVKEEQRRNRALLATYTSTRDIDEARARALSEPTTRVKEIEARIDELKKKRATLAKEQASYTGDRKPPSSLVEQMTDTDSELTLQSGLLDSKRRDIQNINDKYDADKKRYVELTGRK